MSKQQTITLDRLIDTVTTSLSVHHDVLLLQSMHFVFGGMTHGRADILWLITYINVCFC